MPVTAEQLELEIGKNNMKDSTLANMPVPPIHTFELQVLKRVPIIIIGQVSTPSRNNLERRITNTVLTQLKKNRISRQK
jgi:hypothetical protein